LRSLALAPAAAFACPSPQAASNPANAEHQLTTARRVGCKKRSRRASASC